MAPTEIVEARLDGARLIWTIMSPFAIGSAYSKGRAVMDRLKAEAAATKPADDPKAPKRYAIAAEHRHGDRSRSNFRNNL